MLKPGGFLWLQEKQRWQKLRSARGWVVATHTEALLMVDDQAELVAWIGPPERATNIDLIIRAGADDVIQVFTRDEVICSNLAEALNDI